jgi:hypothetical protein
VSIIGWLRISGIGWVRFSGTHNGDWNTSADHE